MTGSAPAASEVLVLGAGLAGCTLARRLCAAGARVALVGTATRVGIEGVSVRARALLAEEGIDGALLGGPVRREGHWGSRSIEGQEWLVRRADLALALRARAQAAGATLHIDAAVRLERDPPFWRATLRSGATVRAPILIEARGRGRSQARGPALLALGRSYRLAQDAAAQTRVEVADFGWCWWAQAGRSLWLQIIAAPRARHPRGWVEAAAAQIPALAQALEAAQAAGEPLACAAQARLGDPGGEEEAGAMARWCTGDAAVALDPLSGQGIYQALLDARRVAGALLAGGDRVRARRRLAEQHAEEFRRCARHAAEFYRENAARGAFWESSAGVYEGLARAPRSRPLADGERAMRGVAGSMN